MEDRKIEEKVCEDRISALPEDLLVQKLSLVPINDVMATSMLSKRGRSIWKMLSRLEYTDAHNGSNVWLFLYKSPALEKLCINMLSSNPVNVDVEKLVDNIVNRYIQWLDFSLHWSEEPTSLSKSLYTCKTLKTLELTNKILVDVPSQASLPLLIKLRLYRVVYKDEDSLVRLFLSCPVLQKLFVVRNSNDNVRKFSVKVPSLQILRYRNNNIFKSVGSLVIDSSALKIFEIIDSSGDACLIENMPHCLDMAKVSINSYPNILPSFSSVMYVNLTWINAKDANCSAIVFSRLIECKLTPYYLENWVQPIMHLLHNSPKLKALMIDSYYIKESADLPPSSSVPGCLSSHLEIFEWDGYGETREEKELLTYILANSKSLKMVRILPEFKKTLYYSVRVMEEIESMYSSLSSLLNLDGD